ncbi:pyridoxal phosphate-dependent aminotransferase [Polycladidibacter stylochi]|uniref:pyridoxal phosphate-dependent aminotransferase n=1 Tax=Polycladidibacter stylochi TaxID=1807766 RepID=UPI0009EA09E3|nr:aminotransferase class I/II-fold pyridoxal phosphate-dependent enzyme [Pseudovibrio stylochi]
MEVLQAASQLEAEGKKVLHMEIGQPGAPVPAQVRSAAQSLLDTGKMAYTPAKGLPELQQAIAKHYSEHYGVEVPLERVMVTTGSSAGFNLAFLAGFEPGDRVALTSPGYPAYRNILKALGLEAVEIEVGPETRWALTGEMVAKVHKKTPLKGVLVASPANPTGTMMTPEALKELSQTCEANGIWFISDEIYHGLAFGQQEETALKFSDKAIIVNSFSKYYCMTGWRIGWMILPEELVRPVERLAQSLYISAPHLSQVAAVAAFSATQEYEQIKAGYGRNRQLLLERLPQIGFDRLLPVDGAFYVYASTTAFAKDSFEFCKGMLQEAHVATTPGIDFDLQRGHEYLRFSFAGPEADMALAMEKLEDWLNR